jgi:hypothetical protein
LQSERTAGEGGGDDGRNVGNSEGETPRGTLVLIDGWYSLSLSSRQRGEIGSLPVFASLTRTSIPERRSHRPAAGEIASVASARRAG